MDKANILTKTLPIGLNSKKLHVLKTAVKQKIDRLRGKNSTKVFRKERKPCHLLSLPSELRLIIFTLALSDLLKWVTTTLDPPSLVRLLAKHSSKEVRQEVQEAFEYWIPKSTYAVCFWRYELLRRLEFQDAIYKDTIARIEIATFVYHNLPPRSYPSLDRQSRLIDFFACPHLTNIKHIMITVKGSDLVPVEVYEMLRQCEKKLPKLETINLRLALPPFFVRKGQGVNLAYHYWVNLSHDARHVFGDEGVRPVGQYRVIAAGPLRRLLGFENLMIYHRYQLNPTGTVEEPREEQEK